jgi:hypothetical protein
MNYFGQYFEYVADFKAEQFYLLTDENKRICIIPFDTKLGFSMLKGFCMKLLDDQLNS